MSTDLNIAKALLLETGTIEHDRITIIGGTIFASFENDKRGESDAKNAASIMENLDLSNVHTYLGKASERLIVQAFNF